jgi:DNA-binding response OmpR family regulator
MAKIENLLRRVYQPRIEAVISFNDLSLDIAKAQAMFGGQTIELTKNEAGLLRLLIENQGRVLARQSIIDVLWQSESFVDDNTLTVNVNRLRRKLAQIGAQQRLRTRRGLGYSLN